MIEWYWCLLAIFVCSGVSYWYGNRVMPDELVERLPKTELIKHAIGLVKKAEAGGSSGEYKRHVVYAQLQKDFPEIDHRELSKAIERAVDEAK